MVKKSIELIGTSENNVSEAVEKAVKEAAKTLRGMEWIRVLDYNVKVLSETKRQHQVRLKVFFDLER